MTCCRKRLTRVLVAVLALSLAASVPAAAQTAQDPPDALHRRVLAELRSFTGWLRANDARGFVGEVGWPGDEADAGRWNALAGAWFDVADDEGLWVTSWATGEWWGTTYRLAVYEDRQEPPGVDGAASQAPVLEHHADAAEARRGISVAGAEFGAPVDQATSAFSNRNPGEYGVAYHYDSRATFEYLAAKGLDVVRIPFRWERLQPRLGKALDRDERARLTAAVRRATRSGLKVILDMHNYGAFYASDGSQGVRSPIGSARCRMEDFADVWRRLARRFAGNKGVVAYGLMNEPVGLSPTAKLSAARRWEKASQKALDAVRREDRKTTVMVSGYFWSGAQSWAAQHPDDWIEDPANKFRYEAHHYFDRDNSGRYVHSYEEEVEDAAARGY